MESDAALLERYVTHREEAAFRQIVERHAGMVLGVARRRTGDAALAEEAGQIVFTLLARKAPALRRLPPDKLGGWLHRTALLTAAGLLRSEMRRRNHHTRFAADALSSADAAPAAEEPAWKAALPLMDEAIDSLPEADRRLVVQHFYQRRTFRELSTGTGRTEDAVRKRTGRALERLSAFFRRRGITLSAGAIMSGLGTRVTEAAPAGYAVSATAAAVSGAPSLGILAVFSNTLATMALTKITTAASAVAFLAPLGLHWHTAATAPPSSAPGSVAAPAKNIVSRTSPNVLSRPLSGDVTAAASGRSAAFARFAQELAKVTPPPADELRLAELQRLVFALPEEELALAFELLRNAPGSDAAGPVAAAAAARQAETDPAAALRLAGLLPEALRAYAYSGALQVWARRDFDAAFAWARSRPDTPARGAQLDAVYHDLMRRDPAAALARLEEVPGKDRQRQYRTWALEIWRHSGPDAALAWLDANEPPESRDTAVNDFVRGWATDRPDLAVSYALKHVTNPHQQRNTVSFAFMQWGMHDPAGAISALVALPPHLQTADIADSAGRFIAVGDAAGLLTAAQQLPAGEFREGLVSATVQRLALTDLPRAQETLASLTLPAYRREAAGSLGRTWLKTDPSAARQWIENSPDLPARDKKELLSELNQ